MSINSLSKVTINSFVKSKFAFFFKGFIYLFLDRGEGREEERERNINEWLPLARPLLGTWPATQACALTGNRTCSPSVCRLALNPLSHTSQGSASFSKSFVNFCSLGQLTSINSSLKLLITHSAISSLLSKTFSEFFFQMSYFSVL